MNKNQIQDKIINILAEYLDISKIAIHLDANLRDELNVDSLDSLEIAMEIEEEFNIQFSDDNLIGLNQVSDLVELVVEKV